MSKRIVGEPCNILVNFRVSESMKNELDRAADSQNISSTEYIRRAVKEKLERESSLYSIAAQARTESDIFAAHERRMQELEAQMMKMQLQISELVQPCITQTAGRDAKMNVGK